MRVVWRTSSRLYLPHSLKASVERRRAVQHDFKGTYFEGDGRKGYAGARRSKRGEIKEEEDDDELVVIDDKGKEAEEVLWAYPTLDLLEIGKDSIEIDENDLKRKADLIKTKLEQFGIDVSMHEVHVGPTVVQYTLRPADGVKLSKITSLKNDIALALAAPAVRIEGTIPGKSLMGIEIPSAVRSTVHMREMMETNIYIRESSKIKISLGRDVSGKSMVADLAKMPHLLIAGPREAENQWDSTVSFFLLYNNSRRNSNSL